MFVCCKCCDMSVKELLGKLGIGMRIAVVDQMGNENCCGGS